MNKIPSNIIKAKLSLNLQPTTFQLRVLLICSLNDHFTSEMIYLVIYIVLHIFHKVNFYKFSANKSQKFHRSLLQWYVAIFLVFQALKA